MRLVKMFALTAITAGILTTFFAATSASAVTSLEKAVFCKSLQELCSENNDFATGTVVHAKTIAPPILLSPVNIVCEKGVLLGKTISLLAHASIEAASLENCVEEGGEKKACTLTANHLPYLFLTLLTSNHKEFHVVIEETTKGHPQLAVACPGLSTCTFSTTALLYGVLHTGTNNRVVLSVLQELTGEGLCFFTNAVWHAKYELLCLDQFGTEEGCWPAMESGELTTP